MIDKISVIGAGNVGSATALGIARKELSKEIILVDIEEGIPKGKSLDMEQSFASEGLDVSVNGANDYSAVKDSDIVVITAGLARKPGMSRDDLLIANAQIMREVVEKTVNVAPQSILIIVSNPLDVMAQVAKTISAFEKHRVIGMAGILDTSRFKLFISKELNVSIEDVNSMILGGHGDSMVPLIRFTSIAGIPISELLPAEKINLLAERARKGGIEIVNYLKSGSAYYAPASSTVEMLESIVKNKRKILPCSVYLEGEFGINDVYCGVPVVLGSKGVEKILELKLTANELDSLKFSAEEVRKNFRKLDLS